MFKVGEIYKFISEDRGYMGTYTVGKPYKVVRLSNNKNYSPVFINDQGQEAPWGFGGMESRIPQYWQKVSAHKRNLPEWW